ncbi:MAG TPA: hypothetical protein VN951_11275, partial [Pyrinomonadaceae bacterium]|nr:hypothetical protein [Pyrinomonadaceae bacterium]
GAKKRLANDLRAGGKFKIVSPENGADDSESGASAVSARTGIKTEMSRAVSEARTAEDRKALRKVATELRELLALLEKEPRKTR